MEVSEGDPSGSRIAWMRIWSADVVSNASIMYMVGAGSYMTGMPNDWLPVCR